MCVLPSRSLDPCRDMRHICSLRGERGTLDLLWCRRRTSRGRFGAATWHSSRSIIHSIVFVRGTSVLLSPSVFQQTVTRSSDLERKASSPSPLTVGTSENQRKPSIILSKSQLQDTLIHLIKVCRISI